MVEITTVHDAEKIWKRRKAANPEIVELFNQVAKWQTGETHKVKFNQPYKSLRSALIKEFGDRFDVHVKKEDATFLTWYVKLSNKSRKKRSKAD